MAAYMVADIGATTVFAHAFELLFAELWIGQIPARVLAVPGPHVRAAAVFAHASELLLIELRMAHALAHVLAHVFPPALHCVLCDHFRMRADPGAVAPVEASLRRRI